MQTHYAGAAHANPVTDPATRTASATTAATTATATRMVGPAVTPGDDPQVPVTDGAAAPVEPAVPRRGITARARIVGWLLLIAAVALAATLLISARVLLAQVDDRLAEELSHEATKFEEWVAREVDPATGEPFSSVGAMLAAYLSSSLPDETETYFGLVNGVPAFRPAAEPPARLDNEPQFVERVAAQNAPTSGEWDSTAGPVRYAVLPVDWSGPAGDSGALVVVEFAASERSEALSTLRALGAVSVVALVAAGIVSWLVAGRVLAPIRLVRKTAETISESDLSRRIEVRGSDDVAQLSQTFNRMLDRLETAFAGQRRFLDDAGHELRTPLTVVRGHLELMSDEPEDRTRTLALVMDELDRMTRIVDDLIMLARVEQPDFLTLGLVDLADLTVEVTDKARALGARRWTVPEVAEAVVVADGHRLTQALMQLAHNAVRHTEIGDRIAIGSRLAGDSVQLWVQDHGEGIPVQDQERIFERFARGSGTRAGEGHGLGLAIVRSIAEGHRGRVWVESTVGYGARFMLELPLPRAAGRDDTAVDEETISLLSEGSR